MTEQKPSGSFVAWDNTMCNPLAPARDQCQSAWHDGYASAKQEWVGLTDDELDKLYVDHHDGLGYSLSCYGYERAIEAALRSKNT